MQKQLPEKKKLAHFSIPTPTFTVSLLLFGARAQSQPPQKPPQLPRRALVWPLFSLSSCQSPLSSCQSPLSSSQSRLSSCHLPSQSPWSPCQWPRSSCQWPQPVRWPHPCTCQPVRWPHPCTCWWKSKRPQPHRPRKGYTAAKSLAAQTLAWGIVGGAAVRRKPLPARCSSKVSISPTMPNVEPLLGKQKCLKPNALASIWFPWSGSWSCTCWVFKNVWNKHSSSNNNNNNTFLLNAVDYHACRWWKTERANLWNLNIEKLIHQPIGGPSWKSWWWWTIHDYWIVNVQYKNIVSLITTERSLLTKKTSLQKTISLTRNE